MYVGIDSIKLQQIQLAIGSFILTINSNQTTYDTFIKGDTAVFSDVRKKRDGIVLFN